MTQNNSFRHTVPAKVNFLKELRSLIPGWDLGYVVDMNQNNIFALAPYVQGPLMIGDDMFINDPIVSITNHENAYYGFTFGAGTKELPDNLEELAAIWHQALATYEFVKGKPHRTACSTCVSENRYSGSGLKGDSFCPECFGMGSVYSFGPQKKIGKKLLENSKVNSENGNRFYEFRPEGLQSLFSLYDTYHTGVVTDIVQDYLIHHASDIVQQTFPDTRIIITYDELSDPGLGDFVRTATNKILYRHFYVQSGDSYLNLYTGILEEPRSELLLPAVYQKRFPGKFRWNVTVEILRNLCKFTKEKNA